ncbi:AfsR/SARP family transcriptional regulator, partial [Streptomyces huiliensis]|uniref:AfsR/SARP family transcriptional regulator n=1 Tax=Streptomyces huiliensis TaxID=2876027 RepID=UPI0021DFABD4
MMASRGSAVRFGVLGTLEVWNGEDRLRVGGPRARAVLAALLLEANRVVSLSRLVDAVWEDAPPATAEHQVRKIVAELRARIPGGRRLLVTDGPGYRMVVDDGQLDLLRFEAALARARAAAGTDEEAAALEGALALYRGRALPEGRSPLLAAAATMLEDRQLGARERLLELRLEQGRAEEAVAGLRSLVAEHPLRESLAALLMVALCRTGRQADALRVYHHLRHLLAEQLGIDPGPEATLRYEQILRNEPALHDGTARPARSDAPAPASVPGVRVTEGARPHGVRPAPRRTAGPEAAVLPAALPVPAEEAHGPLGPAVPPGDDASGGGVSGDAAFGGGVFGGDRSAGGDGFSGFLRGDDPSGIGPGTGLTPYPGHPRPATGPGVPAPAPVPTPPPAAHPASVLPRSLPHDLPDFTGREGEIRWLLSHATREPDRPTPVLAVDGMPGIGKTALAVHAAHRLADHYPDGQIHLDLHGFTAGRTPLTAHTALGVLLRAVGVPDRHLPPGRTDREHLWRAVSAGRRLLLLIDNAAASEQVRPLIPGTPGSLVLVTSRPRLSALDGASHLSLPLPPPGDALGLLGAVLGRDRLSAEPEAAADLVTLCGRLPLALRVAAGRLRNRPQWTVAALNDRLRAEPTRLAGLVAEHRAVAAVLDLSRTALPTPHQRFFHLLGLHPGPDFDAGTAAVLTGSPLPTAEALLEDLLDAHLLTQHTPGRYAFHELVRLLARHHPAAPPPATAHRALHRLLDHYLHTATRAAELIDTPARHPAPAAAPAPPWADPRACVPLRPAAAPP